MLSRFNRGSNIDHDSSIGVLEDTPSKKVKGGVRPFSRAGALIRRGVCGGRRGTRSDPVSAGIAPFHKARLIGRVRGGECRRRRRCNLLRVYAGRRKDVVNVR